MIQKNAMMRSYYIHQTMTNSNYRSLGSLLWSLLKNQLAEQLTYEEAAEYCLEAIKLLGAPVLYESKIDKKELTSHKCELPCDLLYIEGVKYYNGVDDMNSIVDCGIPMREATNTFHMDLNSLDENILNSNSNYISSEFTYKIQKGILFSSIPVGCVTIAYKGIATDEEGYPLIPDNQKVQLALEYYTLSRYLEPLWMAGKITDKAFDYIQQKRYFYMASAQTGAQMPTVDKMESIMSGLNRLIVNTTAHSEGFKKYGQKEIIKKY